MSGDLQINILIISLGTVYTLLNYRYKIFSTNTGGLDYSPVAPSHIMNSNTYFPSEKAQGLFSIGRPSVIHF